MLEEASLLCLLSIDVASLSSWVRFETIDCEFDPCGDDEFPECNVEGLVKADPNEIPYSNVK